MPDSFLRDADPKSQILCHTNKMKFSFLQRLVISAIFMFSTAYADTGGNSQFRDPRKNPPFLMSTALSPEAYKVSIARPLLRAELLYFNSEYARELGFVVPAEGITPAFMQEILAALAIQIPAEEDPSDAFGPDEIKVYADGYGADDTVNLGSGRAASFDEWQSKGIGRTQHVRDPDPWHSNGAAYTAEGLKEAFFGEVTNQEFANGANRILAVISTGTFGSTKDHPRIPRALIVRKDPLRPAQYIRNYAAKTPEEINWDTRRVQSVLPHLIDALPQPKQGFNPSQGTRLSSGLNELVDRLAVQLADEYTMRLHHGAYSVSNAMLDGGSIDFGSITGLDGWTRYLTVSIGLPFGDPREAFEWIIEPFIKDLQKNFSPVIAIQIPSVNSMRIRFIQGFQERHLPNRILRLTGVPAEFLTPLRKSAAARDFGLLLVDLTKAGNESVYAANGHVPPDTGTYDIRRLLEKLINGHVLEPADISDEVLRTKVSTRWKDYESVVQTMAKKAGVQIESLRTYMRLSSEIITRKLPETYGSNENFEKWWDMAGTFYATKDRRAIQRAMDGKIERNIRTYKDVAPFELVLWQHSEPEFGYGVRRVFNAKTGQFSEVIRLAESAGKINFFGKVLPLESSGTMLRFRNSRRDDFKSVSATRRGKKIEFRLPVSGNFGPSEILLINTKGIEIGRSIRGNHQELWRRGNPCLSLLHRS